MPVAPPNAALEIPLDDPPPAPVVDVMAAEEETPATEEVSAEEETPAEETAESDEVVVEQPAGATSRSSRRRAGR